MRLAISKFGGSAGNATKAVLPALAPKITTVLRVSRAYSSKLTEAAVSRPARPAPTVLGTLAYVMLFLD